MLVETKLVNEGDHQEEVQWNCEPEKRLQKGGVFLDEGDSRTNRLAEDQGDDRAEDQLEDFVTEHLLKHNVVVKPSCLLVDDPVAHVHNEVLNEIGQHKPNEQRVQYLAEDSSEDEDAHHRIAQEESEDSHLSVVDCR